MTSAIKNSRYCTELTTLAKTISHKNGFKLAKASLQWAKIGSGFVRSHPVTQAALNALTISAASISIWDSIGNIPSFFQKAWEVINEPAIYDFCDSISKGCGLVTTLPNISSWGHLSGAFLGFMHIPHVSLTVSAASFFGSSFGIYKNTTKLEAKALQKHQHKLSSKLPENQKVSLEAAKNHLWIGIARNICYIAMAIFTTTSTLQIYTAHKSINLAINTLAIMTSIGSDYFATVI